MRASTQLSEPKQALQSEINMPAAAQQPTWGELDLNDDNKTFAEYGLVGDEEVLMLKRKVSDDTLKKSQEFESWFTQQRVNVVGDVTVRQEAVDHECFVDSQVTQSPAQAHSDGMVMDEEQKIKALLAACLHLLAAAVASKIKLCCLTLDSRHEDHSKVCCKQGQGRSTVGGAGCVHAKCPATVDPDMANCQGGS